MKLYKRLYDLVGQEAYLLKVCEELAELQVALLRYRDGKASLRDVLIEVADADIQLDKIVGFVSKFNTANEIDNYGFVFDKRGEAKRNLQTLVECLEINKEKEIKKYQKRELKR